MAAMTSVASALATKKITDMATTQVKADLARAQEITSSDLKQVKQDTVNALNQLQNSVINSLTQTETYALGQCLNRCKTAAKAMIAAHNMSLRNSNLSAGSGRHKKRKTSKITNKKRTNKRRYKKNSKTKKYH